MTAELSHLTKTGGGVTAGVLHNRLGLLGEWKAANSSQITEIKDIEMMKGDSLDFVVTGSVGDKDDAYHWAPTVSMPEREMPGMFGMAMRWDAKSNFQDPAKAPRPLNGWEELAQVQRVFGPAVGGSKRSAYTPAVADASWRKALAFDSLSCAALA